MHHEGCINAYGLTSLVLRSAKNGQNKCVGRVESSTVLISLNIKIVGKTYQEVKAIANNLGINADDKSLWSDTRYVRELLSINHY